MENNDKRPCPTGPGWWYRDYPDEVERIVHVWHAGDGYLLYHTVDGSTYNVQDDGRWLGPVPMPGEWAPRKLFEDLRYSLQDMRPGRAKMAVQVLSSAREWSNANPEPEEKL